MIAMFHSHCTLDSPSVFGLLENPRENPKSVEYNDVIDFHSPAEFPSLVLETIPPHVLDVNTLLPVKSVYILEFEKVPKLLTLIN